jgi:hypothetical protein
MSCAVGTVTSGDPDRFVSFRTQSKWETSWAVDKFQKPGCYLRILSGHS